MYTMIPFRRQNVDPFFSDPFFRPFFDFREMPAPMTSFRMDVSEDASGYTLEAELPGIRQEDITLNVENDMLTIAGDVNTSTGSDKVSRIHTERRSGHFERSISLEGVDQDAITAAYENGVLTVRLPKVQPEPAKGARRIAIQSKTPALSADSADA